jgi:hypothetical protein
MKPNTMMLRAAAISLAGLLLGCAAPAPLHHWNSYPTQVYSYLRNNTASREEQIQALEKAMAQSVGSPDALPPVYQAPLGLLPLHADHSSEALHAWKREKALFPESTHFIDYLIGKLKKNRN